ncbi:hypothetical protein AURDEDRAFT_70649 [Auricularia subglabra TFB-10046 SS5]|nr:hypothetical protein AURDEDRAFT_70649 [Auricularia subglabra TFB-10046 SS5]
MLAIRLSPTRGRGVYGTLAPSAPSAPAPTPCSPPPRTATDAIEPNTVVERSPVLLFGRDEYETHGRHTLLDHYTFKWKDGRMALALGLGSLFNHSAAPNTSYSLKPDPHNPSIEFTVLRRVEPGEELCIFYGHSLWFAPDDAPDTDAALPDSGGGEEDPFDLLTLPADVEPEDTVQTSA